MIYILTTEDDISCREFVATSTNLSQLWHTINEEETNTPKWMDAYNIEVHTNIGELVQCIDVTTALVVKNYKLFIDIVEENPTVKKALINEAREKIERGF